jgi:tetratricopeptide (TPR) repeat protein
VANAGQPAAGAAAALPLGGTLPPLAPAERIHAILINESRYAEAVAADDRAAPLARTPQDQSRLTALRRETAFEWGTSELRTDHPAVAVDKLGQAWAFAAAEPPAQRAQVLTPLGQALVLTGAFDQAAKHYRQTLTLALDPPLKARLQDELRGILVAWAEREEKENRPQNAESLYEETLALLPAGERSERQRLAAKLDGLYDARKAFAKRIALFEALAAAIPDPELAEKLRLYRSRIYLAWGQSEAARKELDSALQQFHAGLKLLKPGEWRQRHELTAALGEALLQRKQYEPLVAAYLELVPSIDDPKFQAQVRGFLGQVYVEWGKAAQARKEAKAVRVRFEAALDNLPRSDWQRRLVATNGLAALEEREGRQAETAARYALLIPDIPAGRVRNEYSLFVGRLYRDKLRDFEAARQWLRAGDGGDSDAISLESGYELAELEVAAGNKDTAISPARTG